MGEQIPERKGTSVAEISGKSNTESFDVCLPKRRVRGTTIAYREAGVVGDPVVLFLHGNPTSSFIWRNILPRVATVAHCIAPDLVGFGQSGKPEIDYRFFDHVRYMDDFIDTMGFSSAYIVAQDWGTALAFHLAARRPSFVRGLVFMEFIRPVETWGAFLQAEPIRELFKKFRIADVGEKLILEDNVFIERVLLGSIARRLSEQEVEAYRAPFRDAAARRPIWRLPNDLPIAGAPADVDAALTFAHKALQESEYPKLLLVGNPGALVTPSFADEFAGTLRNCVVVRLKSGAHYLQEDEPEAIGSEVVHFINEHCGGA
jgi:haloalkane dehalogenase